MNMKSLAAALALAVLAAPFVSAALLPATSSDSSSDDGSSSNGANKYSVAGSSIEFLGPLDGGLVADVLGTSIKTSVPTDLIIQVTLECALTTTVATVGNEFSEAMARVKVWVEVDGVAVPVSSDDAEEPGKVVFCDRLHRQTVTDLSDEDARIEQHLATRTANAFNWIAVDFGGGSVPHDVVVKAELSSETTEGAFAQASIGHRTIVVEPVKLAKGDTV